MVIILINNFSPGSVGYANPSGLIDSEIFLEWLEDVKTHSQCSASRKVFLILDKHSSHLSLPAIDFARDNGIVMLSIPPHTSHC